MAAAGGRVGQGELEVVKPIGRAAAVLELALIGERRALGCGLMSTGKECQHDKEMEQFSFHNDFWLVSHNSGCPKRKEA